MDSEKNPIVLLAGGFCGGWIWRDVVPLLNERGYKTTTPTCTGLGERRHLTHGCVDLSVHLDDVCNHLEMEDLWDVTLVGWSFSGMLLPGTLARSAQRIKSLIYLDAFVPEHGKALVDYLPPAATALLHAYSAANNPLPTSIFFDLFDIKDRQILEFLTQKLVAHPSRTGTEPAVIPDDIPRVPTTYIRCVHHPTPIMDEAAERMAADPEVRVVMAPMDHLCMLTAPDHLVSQLLESV